MCNATSTGYVKPVPVAFCISEETLYICHRIYKV